MNKITALVWILLLPATCLGWLRSDLNQDGIVDLQDFAIVSEEWLMSNRNCLKLVGHDETLPQTPAVPLGSGDFTMMAFIKPEIGVNGIGIYTWNYGPPGIDFYHADGKLVFSAWGWPDDGNGICGPSYAMELTGAWMHIAVVANHTLGTCVLWVNGNQVASAPINHSDITPVPGALIRLGQGGGKYFYGLIDDFRIYKKALTVWEVLNIYNDEKGRKYHPSQTPVSGAASLVFEFDETSGDTCYDTINRVSISLYDSCGHPTFKTRIAGGVPFTEEVYIPQNLTGLFLADEVAEALNTEIYAASFTAARHLMPFYELKDLAQLKVTVAPRTVEIVPHDRNNSLTTCDIDIAIQKAVASPDDLEVSQLADLVMAIAKSFRHKILPCGAACSKQTVDPIYSADHMQSPPVFTSVITLSFKWVS